MYDLEGSKPYEVYMYGKKGHVIACALFDTKEDGLDFIHENFIL